MKGFTLIELLVVVLIIGILSSVALPQYTKAVEKSRASEAITLLKSIGDAKEVYFMSNGNSPTTFADLDISFTSSNGSAATGSSFETKNFTYRLGDFICEGGLGHASVSAARKDSNYPYRLLYCPDLGIRCIDSNNTSSTGSGTYCKMVGFSRKAGDEWSANCISAACWAM